MTSCMQVSMVLFRKSFSRRCSISRARLHRIIGSAKFLRLRVPGCDLSHFPLGLLTFERIISNVFRAISAYSWFPLALLSCPNAIVANVYEKILYGSIIGFLFWVIEKYKL